MLLMHMYPLTAILAVHCGLSSPTCPAGENCFAAPEHLRWSLLQSSAKQTAGRATSNLEAGHDMQKPGILRYFSDALHPAPKTVVPQSNDTSLCEADAEAAEQTFCPSSCPYAAEMSNEFCHFRCVQSNQCGLLGTVENATIPDDNVMACRHCKVEACAKCVAAAPGQVGEKLEHCVKCMPGYTLSEEGECEMNGISVFIAIGVVGAIAAVGIIWWYAMICSKPCVNPEGVEYGLQGRHRMKLSQPGCGEPYPLTTNLLTTNVAGPATMAFFRYEAAILVWAIVLLLVWLGFAFFVSMDLLTLGTRIASTPQLLCAVVAWGRKRQMELVWTKVSWLAFAYVFSFLGAIAYGIQQTKMIATVNDKDATMTSFALKLEGLPKFNGKDPVEEKITTAVKKATGINPVGVSVAWNYEAHADEIEEAIDAELEEKITAAVKKATGINPVGVSVAWNYEAHADEIEHAIDAELEEKITAAVKKATGINPVGVSVAWNYEAHADEIESLVWCMIATRTQPGLSMPSPTRCSMPGTCTCMRGMGTVRIV
eukprot:TRINITY_DN822_c0_g1_i3.p1 TRINITY_DN822_c0_g1~~TRINITY_DN822_c0_g1_i3.p1  ORF type:complete len:541 (+),score=90.34 TRINITY_DN822_c0_g1_i3:97-1719(+)